jgi:predicted phosphodiesterase
MSRVLVIGDTHCPTMRDDYVPFLLDCYEQWDCDRVVHIGDLVDNAALSYHLKDPHLKDPMDEYYKAYNQVQEICQAFPEVDWMIGNHDDLPKRWLKEVGIPESFLKSYADIWEVPDTWTVHQRYSKLMIDGVLYQHGDRGKGGRMAATANAKAEFCSVVQGHLHAQFGVEYYANDGARVFGMQVGCGVDDTHAAMDYGKKYVQRSVIGCGVVLDGITAIVEPMVL